ncbi:hypothetical protein KO516_06315 [Citreicella sp. C3M06]|uniref:hypothetical protein n=1 Tax=Citreicella sp. C3M06 TaxID=2841564 RepID=UPI001C0846FA|nr:hypothetical protein [Citreicella sp. C3M06]MBU2960435.1 hypothetical protein [Citreicella sp. C3M06]
MSTQHWMTLGVALTACLSAQGALAEVCDYRPSKLIEGSGARQAVSGGATGVYTLVNSKTGATLLGSALGSATAAGTSGLAGAAATLANPLVWVPALVVGVGGGGYEALCAFVVDERITDFDEVLAVMRAFRSGADPEYFQLFDAQVKPAISIRGADNVWTDYAVEDLYIVEGVLKQRKSGRDETLGKVVYVPGSQMVPDDAALPQTPPDTSPAD